MILAAKKDTDNRAASPGHHPTSDATTLWVNDFTEDKARVFNDAVLKAAYEDSSKPIVVYIDSYGGAVDALSSMISVLDSVPNFLVTACVGKAMSCGAILLSHGDARIVAPDARVMVHEVSAAAFGNVNDIETDTEEISRLNKYFMGLLAANCGFTNIEAFRANFSNTRREIYLSAKDAVKFGVADQIGLPQIHKQTQYVLAVSERKDTRSFSKTKKTTKAKRKVKKS